MTPRTRSFIALMMVAVSLRLGMAVSVRAAETAIQGRVRDAVGAPVPNVTVSVEGRPRTATDERGEFTLRLPPGAATIVLHFEGAGFHPRVITLDATNPGGPLEVQLAALPGLREDVVVVARQDLPLAENPAGTSIVEADAVRVAPRAVAADEVLQAVPGVKVDNQANGGRVHLSIRGQGILTERGVRGIEVLLDGIPLNDASGFVPDLFDVDWATVQQVGVLRGPVAFLYGGGSGGGVIDIRTRDGAPAPIAGGVWTAAGANAFYKLLGEASGEESGVNYRVSASHTAGDGYRDHSKFWANNVYAKARWGASDRFEMRGVLMGTSYFNENAEGLNLEQVNENPRLANPDALTFNEYQKTERVTAGFTGLWTATARQSVSFALYFRHTKFRESVPSSVQHRTLDSPGGSLQYDLHGASAGLTHHLTAGVDLDGQDIDEYRRPNEGGAVEGDTLLSDETIRQRRVGGYVIERVGLGPEWTVLLGGRFDRITHDLADHLRAGGVDLSGDRTFERTTGRVGVTWNPRREVGLYGSWGQGFLPPATEELFANPAAFGGLNQGLEPATSTGEEVGVRGVVGEKFSYTAGLFHLHTAGDFERYRIPGRPLETFYRNAGDSRRYGLETWCAWRPVDPLALTLAYTYSDFVYTIYRSVTFGGDMSGRRLPNSPVHQVYAEAAYESRRGFFAAVNGQGFSKAYIDPTNATWIDGYALVNARVGWRWRGQKIAGQIMGSAKNLFDKAWIAFTEPDPDGNSYQPGPGREYFVGVEISWDRNR